MVEEDNYKIELTTKEPLRIGGKKDPMSETEKSPVTMVGNRVVIPGSTLKGALRSEIEHFLIDRYYDKQNNRWPTEKKAVQPCIPATKLSKDEELIVTNGYYKFYTVVNKGCHYECKDKCGKEIHTICPTCYLLGSMGLNGFVRVPFLFSDALPEELYSTRLDRVKGTVVTGTNRPVQLVPPGVKFNGVLNILTKNDMLKWELGQPRQLKEKTGGDAWLPNGDWEKDKIIKDLIVERIKNIKKIGGYQSKGFGVVEITASKI
jgi:CRISPR/Cas system CSM-associated protein Csm3 (group 7 of RAMP superfamily)